MTKIKVKLYDNDVILPKYQTDGSSGMDVHAYLRITEGLIHSCCINGTEIEAIDILPGDIKIIDTGLSFEIPEGYEIQVRSRSGLSCKGIVVNNSPGTIDSSYRGTLGIILKNQSAKTFTIYDGDRIAQIVLQKVPKIEWVVVESLTETDRGDGGFGSTGTR